MYMYFVIIYTPHSLISCVTITYKKGEQMKKCKKKNKKSELCIDDIIIIIIYKSGISFRFFSFVFRRQDQRRSRQSIKTFR